MMKRDSQSMMAGSNRIKSLSEAGLLWMKDKSTKGNLTMIWRMVWEHSRIPKIMATHMSENGKMTNKMGKD